MKHITSALYIQFAYDALARHDVDIDVFLEKNNLAGFNNMGEFYPLEDVLTYWRRAEETTGYFDLGFDVARKVKHSDMGLFIYALMNCDTMGEAYEMSLHVQKNLCGAIHTDLTDVDDGIACATLYFDTVSADDARHLMELNFTLILSLARIVAGLNPDQEINYTEVHFRHSKKHPTKHYEKYFGCPVLFGQEENRAFFDKSMLDIKIKNSDSRVKGGLIDLIDTHMEIESEKITKPFTAKVKTYLESHLGKKLPDSSEAAQYFAMSLSTFRRKMALEKTTYHQLLDSMRASFAEHLLKESDYSIDQISEYLDFSDISSFTRAFKRWKNGLAPTDYRLRYQNKKSEEGVLDVF